MPVNLLTANQANGTESTATTGLVTTGAGSTVTSSTTQKFSGSRAIKCAVTSGGTGRGVKTTTTAITLAPVPTTFQAKVYCSVACVITLTGTSSSASFTATATVSVPATTWTTITAVGTPVAAATDGVLTVATGEDKAVDIYVDELGAWEGIGGDWRLPGVDIVNQGGVNSNQVDYYAGLAPISTVEKNAIAAGKNDNEIDWVP
jgi:hypothetical protein